LLKEPKTVNPMGMEVVQLGLMTERYLTFFVMTSAAKTLSERMFELAWGYKGGVFGAVLLSKENDAVSTKTSHARSSLTKTHIAFGGMEASVPCERL
jgi:hypothetical protein